MQSPAAPGVATPTATADQAHQAASATPAGEGTPAAAPTAAAAHVMPASAAASTAAAGDANKQAGEIDIRAIADCWIQVRDADHAILFSRVLKAGETYRVPHANLVMRVGNAGALAIAVDGKAAPPLGPLGALRRDVVLDPQALLAGTAVHG